MTTLLKSIDIYGAEFNLNVKSYSTNRTVLGGLTTLLTVAILIAITFLFGNNFFFRLNPRVISQQIVEKQSAMVLPTTTNFTIPFRIEDVFGNFIDLEDTKIKFQLRYIYLEKNPSGAMEPKHIHFFSLKKCTDIPAATSNTIDPEFNLKSLYCIDWDEITAFTPYLGGYWDEDKVAYLSIHLNQCAKLGGADCASLEETKHLMANNVWIFSVFFPSFYFDTGSFDSPLKTYFQNEFVTLSAYNTVIENLNMQRALLEDDVGWIFSDTRNYQTVSLESFRSFFSTIVDDDEGEFMLYNWNLYFRKRFISMKRNFVKIQELAAQVGGAINVVYLGLSLIIGKYSELQMFKRLVAKFEGKNKQITALQESNVVMRERNNTSLPKTQVFEEEEKVNFIEYCLSWLYKGKRMLYFQRNIDKIESKFEVGYLLNFLQERENRPST